MYFFGHCIMKTLSLLTVLLSPIIVLGEATEEKKYTSELSPRAADDADEYSKPAPVIRADSFSDSGDNAPADASKLAGNRKSDYDDDDNSGDGVRIRSTKGLDSAEFQPEENPSVHAKYKGSDSDSDDLRKRRKREARLYDILKKKGKKIVQHYKKKFSKL